MYQGFVIINISVMSSQYRRGFFLMDRRTVDKPGIPTESREIRRQSMLLRGGKIRSSDAVLRCSVR